MAAKKTLTPENQADFLEILKTRFEKNMHRHPKTNWEDVQKKLEENSGKLWSLSQMETSGGEPDVVEFPNSDELIFVDCAAESPKGRRSFCYDREAWEKRKEHKPANTAVDFAKEIDTEILNEEQYRALQNIEAFDLKTSSWIKTPEKIRKLGGAIFCDRRFDTVFTYHNGAESYYGGRGFRTFLTI